MIRTDVDYFPRVKICESRIFPTNCCTGIVQSLRSCCICCKRFPLPTPVPAFTDAVPFDHCCISYPVVLLICRPARGNCSLHNSNFLLLRSLSSLLRTDFVPRERAALPAYIPRYTVQSSIFPRPLSPIRLCALCWIVCQMCGLT